MDSLRQKLAERLGAQKAPGARQPEVRVENRQPPVAKAAPTAAIHPDHGDLTLAPRASRPSRPAKAAAHATPVAAGHAGQTGHTAHWDYEGDGGPGSWGQLKPEFSKCGIGQRQSPIDIRGGIAVQLEPIQFDYRVSGFSVIDNGHTVQVNLPAGHAITVLGRRYELLQFHFHRPSEERINGKQHDMVAHLVHKDAEGKLAVVAVLLDRGSAQPLIQAVWNALPLEKHEAQAAPGTIDLNKLLPEDRRYYTYMGSLTTPPCSEGVLWMVLKTPVTVSPDQIEIFSRLYPMNARPVQPLAGRLIKESQ
jgi:carbonic anhydrase